MGADQREPFCLAAVHDEEQRQPKIEHDDDEEEDLELIMEGNETSSFSSGSTADLLDDASSSSSTSSSESNGALFNLSELMSHLPMKRGLSKFYQGKSQSFTSLARVTTLEDLAKSGSGGYGRRMKANKSCGGGLNLINTHGHQQQRSIAATSPKATISKKYSSLSCLRGKINHNTLIVSKCNK